MFCSDAVLLSATARSQNSDKIDPRLVLVHASYNLGDPTTVPVSFEIRGRVMTSIAIFWPLMGIREQIVRILAALHTSYDL